MKRSNKKGFTIVELVIVIAVIAVLAAVLIPTFSNLVKKANIANDTAVAKNMNTALVAYSAASGTPETFSEVLAVLEDAGYVLANLNASADGNLYGWDKANNQIVYLAKDGEVIYKNADFKKEDLEFIVSGGVADLPDGYEADKLVLLPTPTAEKTFRDSLESGISVALTEDLTLKTAVVIPKNSNVVLDLGGKTCTTEATNVGLINQTSLYLKVEEGATLTIKNGTFEGRGIMNNGGTIIIEDGVTVNSVDYNGGACIRNKSGEVIVNGGEFNVLNYTKWVKDDGNKGGAPVIYNETGTVTINGGNFSTATEAYMISQYGNGGSIVINGGTFKSVRGIISAEKGGNVTVNGGEFFITSEHIAAADKKEYQNGWFAYVDNGGVIINGGEFTTVAGGGINETTLSTSKNNGCGDESLTCKAWPFCIDNSNGTVTVAANVTINGVKTAEAKTITLEPASN